MKHTDRRERKKRGHSLNFDVLSARHRGRISRLVTRTHDLSPLQDQNVRFRYRRSELAVSVANDERVATREKLEGRLVVGASWERDE